MGHPSAGPSISGSSPLHLYSPGGEELHVAHWRINGHPIRVVVWTSEQWEGLEQRPSDAQYVGCGVWCALRLG